METIVVILMLVTFVALIIGLVNPSLIMRWSAKPSRWKVLGWYLLINVVLSILLAISNPNSDSFSSKDEQNTIEQTGNPNSDSLTSKDKQNTIEQTGNKKDDIEIQKKKVANEIKSWGAKDAYFNEDNYFVYCVDPDEISGSADEVARAMFPNVEEVHGVKGCIVVDFKTKKELGKYDAQ